MIWFVAAIILYIAAITLWVASLFTPERCKPPRRDRNRRGFPLRLTLWTGAAALTSLGVIATIISSGNH